MKFFKSLTLIILCFASFSSNSGSKVKMPLDVYDFYIGGAWYLNNLGSEGGLFQQKIVFESDLNKNVVHAYTFNKTNEDTAWVLRNNGLRYYDKADQKIKFLDITKFGDVHQGIIYTKGDTMMYDYEYDGALIRDTWTKITNDSCSVDIGFLKGDGISHFILKTYAIRLQD